MLSSPYPDIPLPSISIPDFLKLRQRKFRKSSDNIAVIDSVTSQSYSFKHLNVLTDKFAVGLSKLGLKKGDVIAVVLPNCLEFAIIFLGALKIGAIITTSNPVMTERDMEFQFNDSCAKILFSKMEISKKVEHLLKTTKIEKNIYIDHPSLWNSMTCLVSNGFGQVIFFTFLKMEGAAPLGAEIESAVSKKLGVPLFQTYGMTELSPITHICPIKKIKSGSIGVLLPNLEAKIIDNSGAIIKEFNTPGELCIKGPNVMKGYLNNQSATSSTIDNDGFLHTGDVATVDSDGYFYIVDRVKELIKYKGYQVAPAKLEEILLSHHAIADSAVIGVPDEEAGELPKAFVVTNKGMYISEKEIQDFVAKRVAPFMKLRGGVEFINEIPKSPSGKILRRLLRDKFQKSKK